MSKFDISEHYRDPSLELAQQALLASIQRAIDIGVERRTAEIVESYRCVKAAVKELVDMYGMVDGTRHKQWVIDQLLQLILGEVEYPVWLRRHDYEAMQAGTARWDFGIAP